MHLPLGVKVAFTPYVYVLYTSQKSSLDPIPSSYESFQKSTQQVPRPGCYNIVCIHALREPQQSILDQYQDHLLTEIFRSYPIGSQDQASMYVLKAVLDYHWWIVHTEYKCCPVPSFERESLVMGSSQARPILLSYVSDWGICDHTNQALIGN